MTETVPSFGTLMGHSLAGKRASKTLHEASSSLFVLARTIEETPEAEVDQHHNLWADTIRLIGKALSHEGLLVDGWLKAKELGQEQPPEKLKK